MGKLYHWLAALSLDLCWLWEIVGQAMSGRIGQDSICQFVSSEAAFISQVPLLKQGSCGSSFFTLSGCSVSNPGFSIGNCLGCLL